MPQPDEATALPERIRAGAERRRWAAALIAVRQASGLSQQQASRLSGLSQATVSRIEHATTTPTRESLDRLLSALGVAPDVSATTAELLDQVERSLADDRGQRMEASA